MQKHRYRIGIGIGWRQKIGVSVSVENGVLGLTLTEMWWFSDGKLQSFAEDLLNLAATTTVASLTDVYTYGDSDVISFHIYASWFSSPSCG